MALHAVAIHRISTVYRILIASGFLGYSTHVFPAALISMCERVLISDVARGLQHPTRTAAKRIANATGFHRRAKSANGVESVPWRMCS